MSKNLDYLSILPFGDTRKKKSSADIQELVIGFSKSQSEPKNNGIKKSAGLRAIATAAVAQKPKKKVAK